MYRVWVSCPPAPEQVGDRRLSLMESLVAKVRLERQGTWCRSPGPLGFMVCCSCSENRTPGVLSYQVGVGPWREPG